MPQHIDRRVTLLDESGDPINVGNPLYVSGSGGGGGGGTSQADKSSFAEGSGIGTPIMGVFNETLAAPVLEDKAAAVRITSYRALHANLRDDSGNELGTALSPLRTDPTGTTPQPVSGTVTVTDGGGSITVDGTIAATQSGSWTVAASQSGSWSVSVTGSVTVASLNTLDYDTGAGTVTQAIIGIALPGGGGPVAGGTTTNPVRTDPTGSTAQPVTDGGGSLTVDGAVTVSGTIAATQSGSWTVTANAGTGTFAVKSEVQVDYDSGAGTQSLSVFGLALPGSGGAVAGGTATNPVRTDPTGSTAQPVTDNGGSLTVDGTVTVSGSVTVSGTVAATQSGAWTVTANAGTGTFTVDQVDTASLDYDSGAGTVNQTVIGIALPGAGGPVAGGTATNPVRTDPTGSTAQPVTDNGGSLTVDGAVTVSGSVTVSGTVAATQSGAWTVDQGTGGSSAWKVDGSAVTQPVSGTVAVTQSGTWTVNAIVTGGSIAQDKTAFVEGTTNFTPVGAVVNDTLAGDVAEDNRAALRMTPKRSLHVNLRDASAIELGTAGNPVRTDPTGTTAQPITDNGGSLTVDGTVSISGSVTVTGTVAATQSGTWTVTQSGTWNVGLSAGSNTVGKVDQGTGGASAWKVDGSAVTQPVSGSVSVSGAVTVSGTVAATQSGTWTVQPGNTANTTAWKVDGSAVTQPVSGTFWQATQPVSGTVTANAGTGTFTVAGAKTNNNAAPGATNVGTLGAVATAAAPTLTEGNLVALSTDLAGSARVTVTNVPAVSQSGTWNVGLTAGSNTIGKVDQGTGGASAWKVDGSAVTQPVSGTVSVTSANTADYDSGAGTVTQTMFGIALPASGGPVAGGTATNPVRVDVTGTTAQPITDNGGSLTVDGTVAISGSVTVTGTVAATQSGAWSVTADTELPAAALLNDTFDTATTNVPSLGAIVCGLTQGATTASRIKAHDQQSDARSNLINGLAVNAYGYISNGSSGDRVRGANAAANTSGTGLLGVGNLLWDSANSLWQQARGSSTGIAILQGALTHNSAVPGATNIGALVALANASAPTYNEGDQVLLSVGLDGSLRTNAGADIETIYGYDCQAVYDPVVREICEQILLRLGSLEDRMFAED